MKQKLKVYLEWWLAMQAIFFLCMVAGLVGCIRMQGYIWVRSDRAWRAARAYDRVGNVAIGGIDTETVSSHANRANQEGYRWGCLLCWLLDKVQKNHCLLSAGV